MSYEPMQEEETCLQAKVKGLLTCASIPRVLLGTDSLDDRNRRDPVRRDAALGGLQHYRRIVDDQHGHRILNE